MRGYPPFVVAHTANVVGARRLFLMSLLVLGAVHDAVVHGSFETVRPTVLHGVPLLELIIFYLLFFGIIGVLVGFPLPQIVWTMVVSSLI